MILFPTCVLNFSTFINCAHYVMRFCTDWVNHKSSPTLFLLRELALRPERVIIMNIISSGTTKLLYHCLFLYNKWQRDFRKGLVNPIDPIKGALMFSLVPYLMNLLVIATIPSIVQPNQNITGQTRAEVRMGYPGM